MAKLRLELFDARLEALHLALELLHARLRALEHPSHPVVRGAVNLLAELLGAAHELANRAFFQ